jgi:hypothetical protein
MAANDETYLDPGDISDVQTGDLLQFFPFDQWSRVTNTMKK